MIEFDAKKISFSKPRKLADDRAQQDLTSGVFNHPGSLKASPQSLVRRQRKVSWQEDLCALAADLASFSPQTLSTCPGSHRSSLVLQH